MQHYIGVDGGGSKTAVVVIDESGRILARAGSGPSNFLRVGMSEAVEHLREAVSDGVAFAGIPLDQIAFAYLGIAGADHPRHRNSLVEAMRGFFPDDNFTIDNDARIALTGAVGLGAGIVVIAGTGSVAFGRNAAGVEARAGGWGPTLGDEGSGYSIARRGLAAVVRAYDGRDQPTSITQLLCQHYDMCSVEDLPFFIYAPTTHVNDIAAYCKIVIEAARDGDAPALQILKEEGKELGETVRAVARKLGLLGQSFPIAYVGGAFNAGSLLLDPMREILSAEAPDATFHPPKEPPAMGAARMAIEAAKSPRER